MRYGLYGLSELLNDKSVRNLTLDALDEFGCGHNAHDVMSYLREGCEPYSGKCEGILAVCANDH